MGCLALRKEGFSACLLGGYWRQSALSEAARECPSAQELLPYWKKGIDMKMFSLKIRVTET